MWPVACRAYYCALTVLPSCVAVCVAVCVLGLQKPDLSAIPGGRSAAKALILEDTLRQVKEKKSRKVTAKLITKTKRRANSAVLDAHSDMDSDTESSDSDSSVATQDAMAAAMGEDEYKGLPPDEVHSLNTFGVDLTGEAKDADAAADEILNQLTAVTMPDVIAQHGEKGATMNSMVGVASARLVHAALPHQLTCARSQGVADLPEGLLDHPSLVAINGAESAQDEQEEKYMKNRAVYDAPLEKVLGSTPFETYDIFRYVRRHDGCVVSARTS